MPMNRVGSLVRGSFEPEHEIVLTIPVPVNIPVDPFFSMSNDVAKGIPFAMRTSRVSSAGVCLGVVTAILVRVPDVSEQSAAEEQGSVQFVKPD